jgi:hypothetical protein
VTEPSRAVVPALTREQVLEFIDNPLKQLPDEWRIPVWDFWAFFENLLPTQIALCTRIRWWRDREGLTLSELREAMDELRGPDLAATFHFAGQVLATLGDRIHSNRKATRDRERAERERRRLETAPPTGIVCTLAAALHDPTVAPFQLQE